MLITVIGFSVALTYHWGNETKRRSLIVGLIFTLFALLLLSKEILNVRVYQYGFALTGPAAVLLVVGLLDWLPRLLAGKSGGGWIFKTVALAVLIVAIGWHFDTIQKKYAFKTERIGQGCDGFYASQQRKSLAVKQA